VQVVDVHNLSRRLPLMLPQTRYAKSDSINIAYQVFGTGPVDLVLVPGWVSNVDVFWDEPVVARFLLRLAEFSRVVLFDKRGTGLSDPVTDTPSLEERMDDVRSVLDEVGSERAVLLGYSEGGPMCVLFAATYPERTQALVAVGSYPRRRAGDGYLAGVDPESDERLFELIRTQWGGALERSAFLYMVGSFFAGRCEPHVSAGVATRKRPNRCACSLAGSSGPHPHHARSSRPHHPYRVGSLLGSTHSRRQICGDRRR
jgi:pimeloyl-ACP methyl ester carboxylesterase